MRRALDGLYAAGAALAALSLVGILLLMLGQVVMRELGRQLPAADDLVAYLCVASAFGALAVTFRRGELIRVGLAIEALSPRARRVQEVGALTLAALAVAYLTWWTAQDVLFSWEIDDVAQGTVAIPLWIPKLVMPLGAGILLVAILDELVTVLRGARPTYVTAAEERAARGDFSAEV